MAIMGKNIWDNLTTGMYSDSKIIFREYIQNACDAIDAAKKQGLLGEKDGEVEIILNDQNRNISIKDNGLGVPSVDFQRKVGNVADSDKEIGKNKGFRGIGRLCGLAYCDKIVFTSKYKDENIISIMIMDAKELRRLLYEDKAKYTFGDVYDKIVEFSTEQPDNINDHFFKVELFDIRKSNFDLLNKQGIQEYLSFAAPVPYVNSFFYRSKIYEHAKNISAEIDEYKILINGEQIFKNYKTHLYKGQKKNDEIFNVDFEDFYADNGSLIAWMWYGVSTFHGALTEENKAKRLRLRKENIQIGNPETLNPLFHESRGNSYFVGEVFAVSKDLIPNSQRDNFNENDMRVIFEKKLKNFFKGMLSKLYRSASDVRGYYGKISDYQKSKEEFDIKNQIGFISPSDKEKAEKTLENKQGLAEKAQADINKFEIAIQKDTAAAMVANRIKAQYESEFMPVIDAGEVTDSKPVTKDKYITQSLPLDRKGRKLVTQIYQIITDFLEDENLAKELIEKIQEGLK